MAGEGVITRRETQTKNGGEEKDAKHDFVNSRDCCVGGPYEEIHADENK